MSIAKPYVRTSMLKDVMSPSSVNATVDEMYYFSAFLELPNLNVTNRRRKLSPDDWRRCRTSRFCRVLGTNDCSRGKA